MANPTLWGFGTNPSAPAFWGWEEATTVDGVTQYTAYSLTPPPIRANFTGDIENGYNASSYTGSSYA